MSPADFSSCAAGRRGAGSIFIPMAPEDAAEPPQALIRSRSNGGAGEIVLCDRRADGAPVVWAGAQHHVLRLSRIRETGAGRLGLLTIH